MYEWVRKILRNEIIRYGISGGIVTVVNAVCYFLLLRSGLVYTIANVISIVLSKGTAYVLNKFWVYRSENENLIQTFKELMRFILARGFTGLVDFFGLIILIEFCKIDQRVSKIVIMIFVIVLNYVIGKQAVFNQSQREK